MSKSFGETALVAQDLAPETGDDAIREERRNTLSGSVRKKNRSGASENSSEIQPLRQECDRLDVRDRNLETENASMSKRGSLS